MKRCQSDPSPSKVEWFCSPSLLFICGSCFFPLSLFLWLSLFLFLKERKDPLERSGGYMRVIRASLVGNYETLHILCTCCKLQFRGDKCRHEQAFFAAAMCFSLSPSPTPLILTVIPCEALFVCSHGRFKCMASQWTLENKREMVFYLYIPQDVYRQIVGN